MIKYKYKNAKILFIGINPHPGSFSRGIPFSNNKLFWYLLSDSGLVSEQRAELRTDSGLKKMYEERFNKIYKFGFINIINRPTMNVTRLKKGEEIPGKKRLHKIIRSDKPPIICFVGKITYAKFADKKYFSYGWQENIGDSRIFVMHSPLRGKSLVRIKELKCLEKNL